MHTKHFTHTGRTENAFSLTYCSIEFKWYLSPFTQLTSARIYSHASSTCKVVFQVRHAYLSAF